MKFSMAKTEQWIIQSYIRCGSNRSTNIACGAAAPGRLALGATSGRRVYRRSVVLSDRTDHQSLVANGSLKGQTLGQVIGQFREPLMGKLPASTGATILELQIASTSTTGWRTIGLVLRA